MNIKKIEIPYDLFQMFVEFNAIEKLADKLLRMPFMLNKVLKLKIKSENLKSDFWYMSRKIYPELSDSKYNVSTNYDDRVYILREKEIKND